MSGHNALRRLPDRSVNRGKSRKRARFVEGYLPQSAPRSWMMSWCDGQASQKASAINTQHRPLFSSDGCAVNRTPSGSASGVRRRRSRRSESTRSWSTCGW